MAITPRFVQTDEFFPFSFHGSARRASSLEPLAVNTLMSTAIYQKVAKNGLVFVHEKFRNQQFLRILLFLGKNSEHTSWISCFYIDLELLTFHPVSKITFSASFVSEDHSATLALSKFSRRPCVSIVTEMFHVIQNSLPKKILIGDGSLVAAAFYSRVLIQTVLKTEKNRSLCVTC